MALLLRPVRHAVNNLSMVMNANLETAVPQLPEGERVTKQVPARATRRWPMTTWCAASSPSGGRRA